MQSDVQKTEYSPLIREVLDVNRQTKARSRTATDAARVATCMLIACGVMFPALSANATVIISNLVGASGGGTSITPTTSKAMGFTMPDGPDYVLDSVLLRLSLPAEVDPIVEIWNNDINDRPGSALISLDGPTALATPSFTFEFTPSSLFTLTADTTYWLLLRSEEGNFGWLGDDHPPSGIASHFGAFILVEGASIPPSPSNLLNDYAINGTAVVAATVPEPASGMLVISALALLGLGRLRRRAGGERHVSAG